MKTNYKNYQASGITYQDGRERLEEGYDAFAALLRTHRTVITVDYTCAGPILRPSGKLDISRGVQPTLVKRLLRAFSQLSLFSHVRSRSSKTF